MKTEWCSYNGLSSCIRAEIGEYEFIATADFGPRILSCRIKGGANLFGDLQDYPANGGSLCMGGGHRLWVAPEDPDFTYIPDNGQVQAEVNETSITLIAERTAGDIDKIMELSQAKPPFLLRVKHRLINRGIRPRELAPWAVTIMAPEGFALALFKNQRNGWIYSPDRMVCFWPHTNPNDPRFRMEDGWTALRHVPGHPGNFKMGMYSPTGLMAYFRKGMVFVKRAQVIPGARLTDCGANLELYADGRVLEMETLGPLAQLGKGELAEHIEEWALFAVPDNVCSSLEEAANWLIGFSGTLHD